MPFVFVLNSSRLTWLHRNRVRNPFQSLQPRHFVNADSVSIRLKIQIRSLPPRLADDFHLSLKNSVVFLCRVEPVLAAMRLQSGSRQEATYLTGRN